MHAANTAGNVLFRVSATTRSSRMAPAADTPPPITTRSTFRRFRVAAMPAPSARAAPSTTSIAAASPASAACTMTAGSSLSPARADARPAMAFSARRTQPGAPAIVSTHPHEPQPHGNAVGLDLDVPDLSRVPGVADEQPPVQHEAAADAGAQADVEHAARVLSGAQPRFGQRGRVRVVGREGRTAAARGQLRRQRNAFERRQVGDAVGEPGHRLDDPGDAQADRGSGSLLLEHPHGPRELRK